MALIKCPECEHMVSSQADNCPECGMPLRYIACPICGSKRLYSATEGYSGLKGAAGFLTFGAVGLLVGTHGSKDVRITCKDCGNHFPLSKVKKVDMTLSSTSESNTKYKQLINEKKLLDAIKLYKEDHNCSLSEAKEAIDAMRDIPKENNSGCAVIIIFFLAITSFTFLLFS